MEFTIRPLQGHEEYLACVQLQEETWGQGFAERVPASILMVTQKIGGMAAGAFAPDGELVGFVFGISGFQGDRRVHWSDMLAVKPKYRDHGLGRRLKLYQREEMLKLGVETIYWTYDPLEARNAHLNLNRLGVYIESYIRDMYPSESGTLHRGLGMDRFVVGWPIASKRVEKILQGQRPRIFPAWREAPVVNTQLEQGRPQPLEHPQIQLQTGLVRVEIPQSIQEEKAARPDAGRRWRQNTRACFETYLPAGFKIIAFYRDAENGRCFYVLKRGGK